MKTMKDSWREVCDAYLRAFCEKHGFSYDDAYWIGGDVGGIAEVGDYFVSLADMRTDIDTNAPEEAFLEWYDYTLSVHEIEANWHEMEGFKTFVHINFESWVNGAPKPYSDELLSEMDKCIKDCAEMRSKFVKLCEECASGK